MRSFVQTAACGLVASVLVLGGSASRAVAEDDDTSFDQKIIQNVLGKLGVRGGADIEYRERSPLVLPPKIDPSPADQRHHGDEELAGGSGRQAPPRGSQPAPGRG